MIEIEKKNVQKKDKISYLISPPPAIMRMKADSKKKSRVHLETLTKDKDTLRTTTSVASATTNTSMETNSKDINYKNHTESSMMQIPNFSSSLVTKTSETR